MRPTIILGLMIAGIWGMVTPAIGTECKDGARLTITGTVKTTFVNANHTITVKPAPGSISPCDVDFVAIKVARPPAQCAPGAHFTATGSVFVFLGAEFNAERVTCRR